jgi:hypothetical protein
MTKAMDDLVLADIAERRRYVARDIQRRLVAHIAAGGSTDFAPSPMENDPAVYTDFSRAELERSELFLKLPLLAGLTWDVPNPGDCAVFEVRTGFASIARVSRAHFMLGASTLMERSRACLANRDSTVST